MLRGFLQKQQHHSTTSFIFSSTIKFNTSSSTSLITQQSHHISFRNFMGGNMSRSSASQTALREEKNGKLDKSPEEWKKLLTPKQFMILRDKGTDPPHRGEYDEFYPSKGVFVCAGCGACLYEAKHKWNCGCGWPGFYSNISKMVREEGDADGRRVEILCNACNGHLGHVFRGEGFSNPPPNERHCVNSTSLKYVDKTLEEAMAEFRKQNPQ